MGALLGALLIVEEGALADLVDIELAEEVEAWVDDGAAELGEAVEREHMLLEQVIPLGQHLSPQVGSEPDRSVEKSWLWGCAVAFCCCMSQSIVEMVLQSLPAGQQTVELALLNS